MKNNIQKKNFIQKSFGEHAKLLIEDSNLKKSNTTSNVVLNSRNKLMLNFLKVRNKDVYAS